MNAAKTTVYLVKAEPPASLQLAIEEPTGDMFERPVDYATLQEAARLNPFHWQAIQVKVLAAVGLGWELLNSEGVLDPEAQRRWNAVWDGNFQAHLIRLALDFETYGAAYLEVVPDVDGVQAAYHVPACTIWKRRNGGYRQLVNLASIDFPSYDGAVGEHQMMELQQYHPRASVYGIPDWLPALNALLLDANATEWNYQFFQNNCVPATAITVEGDTLDAQAQADLKAFLQQSHKGVANAHRAILLQTRAGATIKFEALQKVTRDMEFIELKKLCRDELVAVHGVPPRLLGIVIGGQLGGGGEMQAQLQFFKECRVRSRQRGYIDFLQPLLPAGYQLRLAEMDITNSLDDAAYYKEMVGAGVLQPNEVRIELGKEPLEGLDEAQLARILSSG